MPPHRLGQDRGPRAMLLSGYAESMTDEGLLAVLIGKQGDQGARSILAQHPIPDGLWRVAAEDLIALDGVGPAGAARLLACLEMSRRAATWRSASRPSINTPEDVVDLCAAQLRGRDREHFWSLSLNIKNRLLKISEVSIGSLNASIVHPRELFKDAVRASAASVVVVHNHPSGDATPSGADIQLTRRLVKAGDVLGIDVLDHVVIGDGGEYASLRDLGHM
jgi:DNA repair protein RadC